jgi:hypothetical protein
VCKAHAALGKAVDRRRLDDGVACATKRIMTPIVSVEDDDVHRLLGRGGNFGTIGRQRDHWAKQV